MGPEAIFRDRVDAGRSLAALLGAYRDAPGTVVLGVPRGGVIVAAEAARELGLPLDVLVVRKIGHPGNPEYAVAAVDAAGHVLRGREPVSEAYLEAEARAGQAEALRRERVYRGDAPPLDLAGRTALIVDDGVATGLTLRSAVDSARAHGAARVIVAVPVASREAARLLTEAADDFVAVDVPDFFQAVGTFYSVFGQTSDAEVVEALRARG
ncbi:MAG: phosphoribosyltransferase [Coriobacteriaceae bacterium]|nr:phosphoribosyltransferase [Coriobacteriaceae bacterium]